MDSISLNAKTRELTGSQVEKVRQQGMIPTVLYGHGTKNQNLEIAYDEFLKVYNEAGESTLIDLVIDEKKPVKVLIQDYQRDPLKDNFIHLDLYQVKMTEEITTDVELNYIGESKAVKELGGVLVKNLDSIEVKCLPGDLISKIDVDISVLETFDDSIYVKDLQVPEKIKVLTDLKDMVTAVSAPRTQKELEELEEKVEEEGVPAEEGAEEEGAPTEEGAEEEGRPSTGSGPSEEKGGAEPGKEEKKE